MRSCRQVIREFAADADIILVNGDEDVKKTTLQELLPDSFGPDYLTITNKDYTLIRIDFIGWRVNI
jgi:hypothetical protein